MITIPIQVFSGLFVGMMFGVVTYTSLNMSNWNYNETRYSVLTLTCYAFLGSALLITAGLYMWPIGEHVLSKVGMWFLGNVKIV